ncbi:ABC transporter permease [Leucobacter chromiireducens]|uniref:ABC transporter permease n=1 Tax=Leucobacter chromiireducens TaxID=283877 RepID=UPI000F63CBBE|nr:ABC transporter permease [Leucobacter chromiireducens]
MTRLSFLHTLRAEFTKTLTLRSIQATLAAAFVVPAALALASGLAFDPASGAQFPIESHGFETAGFGQPLVILLAALISGTEYLDGQLRTTLIATPKRGRVLAAKFLIVAALSALIGWGALGGSVLMKHAALGAHGLAPDQFTAGMGWNLLGVGINYALISLIAAAITIIARTFIVTLVVLVPLVLGVTISLVGVIPLLKYLPDLAGIQLLMPYPGVGVLEPVPGGLVMTLWAVVLSGIATAVFLTRDSPAAEPLS